jgi:hypothetical protein
MWRAAFSPGPAKSTQRCRSIDAKTKAPRGWNTKVLEPLQPVDGVAGLDPKNDAHPGMFIGMGIGV